VQLTEAVRSRIDAAPLRLPLRRASVALAGLLLVGLAVRVIAFWTQTYVLFNDETFQYFEQGHRLAFGTGVVPWEFDDGIRSWLVPGLIAGLMRLSAPVSDDPLVYVRLVRLLCAALSLVIVMVGFRGGERRFGLIGGVVAGGFCAIWFDLVYFAPSVLTEVLAAHFAVLAIFMGDDAKVPIRDPRRLLLIGGLFGLAGCLRFQYGPALLAAMLWQYRLSWRHWRWLLLGSLTVALPVSGLLDTLTLGSPFQSIWLNFARNSIDGISAGMGVEAAGYYLGYLTVALYPLPILGTLLILGAFRMPALAIAAAMTLLVHSLVPHKEVRFIYLAIAIAPILIGLGAAGVLHHLGSVLGRRAAICGAVLSLSIGGALSWQTGTVTFGARWQFDRASVQASLAAHDEPGLCGLEIRDVWFWRSGGYTYLNRDVPIYFGFYDPELKLPKSNRREVVRVMRDGSPVPQFTIDRIGAETSRFSHMIADRGFQEPGYTEVACFDDINRADEPELCLYRRPGGCDEHDQGNQIGGAAQKGP
jgi:GPI mannosyltransferase 3